MINFDSHFFLYDRIGEFHAADSWIHPTRTIESLELILVLEGEIYLREESREYVLGKNQMILLEPGLEHGGTKLVPPPVSFYWFHFLTDLPLPVKTYTGSEYYEIKQLMKRLLHVTNTPGYSQTAADSLGYLIFEELIHRGKVESTSNRVHLNQILEYIKMNSGRNLTVADLAAYFNYNVDYIGKLFRKNMGVGLKTYLAEQRLNLAKDLLLTTDMTIRQVSERIGFENENLFVKFFLYYEKISPTAFRGRYYNTHMNNR